MSTTKEWLMRAWKTNDEISALMEAKRAAYERCTSITAKLKSVAVSGSGDVHDKMDYWGEVSAEADDQIKKLGKESAEILKAILKVDNSTYRTLLIKRYINFETWEQIAVEMNYSYSNLTHKLHPAALNSVRIPKSA